MKKISILLVFIYACSPSVQEKELKWFKGNTHSHTTLSGHADTHPDTVALWYLDRDYNFLILSEHNLFIDPNNVHLPENRRKDFILIAEVLASYYDDNPYLVNEISNKLANKIEDEPNRFDRERFMEWVRG